MTWKDLTMTRLPLPPVRARATDPLALAARRWAPLTHAARAALPVLVALSALLALVATAAAPTRLRGVAP